MPKAAPFTSGEVLPEPLALVPSLLVIETRRIVGSSSQTSLAVTVTVMRRSLWFGGQSCEGEAERASCGGVVSTTAVVKVAALSAGSGSAPANAAAFSTLAWFTMGTGTPPA